MKTHSAPYVPLAKTRDQIAEHIANGFKSDIKYTAVVLRRDERGNLVPIISTPVHLRRA